MVKRLPLYNRSTASLCKRSPIGSFSETMFCLTNRCFFLYCGYEKGNRGCFGFYVTMSQRKWNTRPPDMQKLFTELPHEYKDRWSIAFNSRWSPRN